eukprot:scaffold39307_cov69-Phaeocystis_antarctica.AAC.2
MCASDRYGQSTGTAWVRGGARCGLECGRRLDARWIKYIGIEGRFLRKSVEKLSPSTTNGGANDRRRLFRRRRNEGRPCERHARPDGYIGARNARHWQSTVRVIRVEDQAGIGRSMQGQRALLG